MQQIQLHQAHSGQASVLIVGCDSELAHSLSRTMLDLKHRVFLWEGDRPAPDHVLRENWHLFLCGPATTSEQVGLLWDLRSTQTRFVWFQSESEHRDPPCPGEVLPHDLSEIERKLLLKSLADRALMAERMVELEARLEHALFGSLVCESELMRETRVELCRAAGSSLPLVLVADAGVNDRETAWAVHRASPRGQASFLTLDCESYSSDAFEAELFQLSSESDRMSLLERLDGGTLHLRNVQTLAQTTQKKLIRFIESPAVARLDSHSLRYINLRWVVSTSSTSWASQNAPLIAYLRERNDLQSIRLPTLAERPEDLPELVRNSLSHNSARLGILPPALSDDAWHCLEQFDWPGNEDQLERVTTQILKLVKSEVITAEMIEPWLQSEPSIENGSEMTLAEMERQLIEATFARCAGNREKTAQSLGIGLRTLSGKLREYGYPPRGGPGSNRKRPQPTDEASTRRVA